MFLYDVIVIGSGAAGAAASWKLQKSGLKVLCIEQGKKTNNKEYPSNFIDWEKYKFEKYNINPNIRKNFSDYNIDCVNSDISIANFNGVGGSTILYSAHFPRFHSSDFKVKSTEGVAEDWPISYEELIPYFDLNDKMMDVSGTIGDPQYPEIKSLKPQIDIGKIGKILSKGFEELNWHWWPSYSAILSEDRNDRLKCENIGPCNTGCPIGAKSSVDQTYIKDGLKLGLELRTNLAVKKIIPKDNGLIHLECITSDMQKLYFNCKKLVVACNGIGTPRLLLNSQSEKYPNGLGNSSELVGKNLMLHPLGYIEGEFENNMDGNIGPQGCSIYSHEHYKSDFHSRGFYRGYTMQVLRGFGHYEYAKNLFFQNKLNFGENFFENYINQMNKKAYISIICEDLPNINNHITLDENSNDNFGIPNIKVHYKIDENSKKMLSHGLNQGKKVLLKSGAKKIYPYAPVRNTGWHLMGTTKMGQNKKNSVTDKFGELHDIKNIYIADSSLFVTSSGVNITSTLQAIALYISDNIIKTFNE